jgi:uncharacterized protein
LIIFPFFYFSAFRGNRLFEVMRLLFDEITGKTQRFSISDTHWFPAHEEAGLLLAATADLSVSRLDHETILVKGELSGKRRTVCDRCGEQVESLIHSVFEYQVTTRREDVRELREAECSDDDAITFYVEEPVVEIGDILREQVYLSVPLRTLCREECKGICAGCGAMLNKETCRCTPDRSASPFAVLGKFDKR